MSFQQHLRNTIICVYSPLHRKPCIIIHCYIPSTLPSKWWIIFVKMIKIWLCSVWYSFSCVGNTRQYFILCFIYERLLLEDWYSVRALQKCLLDPGMQSENTATTNWWFSPQCVLLDITIMYAWGCSDKYTVCIKASHMWLTSPYTS